LAELRADWTAVHELSHLFHPYLGSEGRWLAEGLASYYQNVLRARAGLLAPDDAWRRLEAGFGRGRREASGAPLRELSREHRGTMRVYWAGAAFWLEADLALRARRTSLDEVLSQYARCCLRGAGEVAPEAFLADLDRIAGDDTFASLHARYADATTFPPLEDAYAALGLEPRADGLDLSADPRAVALREAIMRRPAP
jgi:predicted metalloprotease with PDZ domain